MLRFDLPVMCAVAFACLPVFFTGWRIDRWEGLLLLGYYGAYTTFLILAARAHPALKSLTGALLFFALPLTVVTLGVVVARQIRTFRKIGG